MKCSIHRHTLSTEILNEFRERGGGHYKYAKRKKILKSEKKKIVTKESRHQSLQHSTNLKDGKRMWYNGVSAFILTQI